MLARGEPVTIRTLTPQDGQIEAQFVRDLSPQSRYLRFHSTLKELSPEMLKKFTQFLYPDSMALIATVGTGATERQIYVARYVSGSAAEKARRSAEVAVAVADDWQGCGIGTRLLQELRKVAVEAGIQDLHMHVLSQNRRMLKLARSLGFDYSKAADGFLSRELGKSLTGGQDYP